MKRWRFQRMLFSPIFVLVVEKEWVLQLDFPGEWGMIFQCKREGNPQSSPAGAQRISEEPFPGEGVLQFQLHFPWDDGKTQNRMEFPANSSSPCKLSINKYSGFNPNRESREGTKILIRGFHLTFIGNYFWTIIKVYQNWFLFSSVTLSFLWNLFIPQSLNLGKWSTRLPKVTVQHQALAIPPNPGQRSWDEPGWGTRQGKAPPKIPQGSRAEPQGPWSADLGWSGTPVNGMNTANLDKNPRNGAFVRVGITLAGWGPTALVINPWNYPFVPWNVPDVHKNCVGTEAESKSCVFSSAD